MKIWVMRIIGAANVAFCIFGLIYFGWSLSLHWGHWPGSPSAKEWGEFFAIAIVSFLLVGYSAYLGVRLMKKDTSSLPRVNLLFIVEILYLVIFIGSSWFIIPENNLRMQSIVIGFWGIAEAPLDPQLALYYPFVGLIAIGILQLSERRREKSPH